MEGQPVRRRYYPVEENVPLSVFVREAIEAHERASMSADELELYEHVNPEAIDTLFEDVTDTSVDIAVRIDLGNVQVSIWTDHGIDIRVTGTLD